MKSNFILLWAVIFGLAGSTAWAGNGGYILGAPGADEVKAQYHRDEDCSTCEEHRHHRRDHHDADDIVIIEHEPVEPVIPAEFQTGKAVADITATMPGVPLKGTATFQQSSTGVSVTVEVSGVDVAGNHGIHVHEVGDCSDEGKAAGGHFNPQSVQHGFLPNDGMDHAHRGDMGNIEIDIEGKGSLSVSLPGVTIKGPDGIDGKAIIIHEKQDDFGQPTGNAGGRVGCGIIKSTE